MSNKIGYKIPFYLLILTTGLQLKKLFLPLFTVTLITDRNERQRTPLHISLHGLDFNTIFRSI